MNARLRLSTSPKPKSTRAIPARNTIFRVRTYPRGPRTRKENMAKYMGFCRKSSLTSAWTASLLASGCGLLFFSPESSVSVPPSRLFPSQWLTASTGTAHITISRDADYYRRDMCYERVSVDGQDQARIQPGERLDV